MNISWTFKSALARVIESIPPAVQIVVAALAAYSFAFYVLGHPNPLLAVTVTIPPSASPATPDHVALLNHLSESWPVWSVANFWRTGSVRDFGS